MIIKCFHEKLSLRQQRILVSLALAFIVIAVFRPVYDFDFVYFDDQAYVTENPHVTSGITWQNLKWSMTTSDGGFYHPLTWLSFLVDYQLFGLNPGGYHGTNLIFHTLGTVLLFLCISLMTGSLWRSALVAALFGVHPLHVEPVAWIAGRKDVLTGFFWFLTLIAYYFYTKKPSLYRYLIVSGGFVMALMAKSMAMTLPFVLLLLDFWPLKRDREFQDISGKQGRQVCLWIWEKAPLILISVFWGILSIGAEKEIGALKSIAAIPLDARFANILNSYVAYLWRMIWPINLSIYYPYPAHWETAPLYAAGVLLLAFTIFAWKWRGPCPYWAMGWLWFLGTLIPVIGLVQIGMHASADRYTYIPLVGLFWAIIWAAAELFSRLRISKHAAAFSGVILIVGLSALSVHQVHLWCNAETLFAHAAKVTQESYLVQNNLGAALARTGKYQEAVKHYEKALQIKANYAPAYFNLGVVHSERGEYTESLIYYRKAIAIDPGFVEAYNNLGIALVMLGKQEEGAACFREALKYKPHYLAALKNLMLTKQEKRGVWPHQAAYQ